MMNRILANPPVILNLSNQACLSGTLGQMPLAIAGVQGALANATILGTVDGSGFELIPGGTADEATASAIAEELLPGASAIVRQVLDINMSLEADLQVACDSISLTFEVDAVLANDNGP